MSSAYALKDVRFPFEGVRTPFGYGRGRWSPAALFAASEPGVWFDPSDISTLYQDSAGTTPVTAAGQPVGLMLDKSKGLVLGPEDIPDPGCVTPAKWFNASAEVAATESGVTWISAPSGARIDPTMDGATNVQVAASGFYEIVLTIESISGGALRLNNISGTYATPSFATAAAHRSILYLVAGDGLRVRCVGTTTATMTGLTVKAFPGYHATQATAGSRPTYQIDAGGRPYLAFDGVDDFLVTPTITPGTDKVQVFAGVRKLSDAVLGIVAELSATVGSNNGSMYLAAPLNSAGSLYSFTSRGTGVSGAIIADVSFAAPRTDVITGLGDIQGDLVTLRANGVQISQTTSDQGTGNYLAYPLYIGRRGGTAAPFNGRIYSLLVRFGSTLTPRQIAQTEAWVARKTGVVL